MLGWGTAREDLRVLSALPLRTLVKSSSREQSDRSRRADGLLRKVPPENRAIGSGAQGPSGFISRAPVDGGYCKGPCRNPGAPGMRSGDSRTLYEGSGLVSRKLVLPLRSLRSASSASLEQVRKTWQRSRKAEGPRHPSLGVSNLLSPMGLSDGVHWNAARPVAHVDGLPQPSR